MKMAINFEYNFPQIARDAGFKLRQYKDGPLDWRLIGCLEIDRILRDQSLEQVDSILSHLSEVPLGNILDTNILDSGISKYFMLSQFSIQYLIFCRKFLDETVRELRESLVESQMEVGILKKSLTESNNEILQLNKKITQIEAIHEVVYPCHLCSKSFVSNEALNIHIGRKHTNAGNRSRRNETPQSAAQRDKDNDRNLINTIKLELEIKQLKERLNVAEKDIRERSAANSLGASPHVTAAPERATKNVAIQSNLMESKEKDDTICEDNTFVSIDGSELRERKVQLIQLQEKIKEFEEWRDLQKINSEESMGAINKKLVEIAKSLESVKEKREEENEIHQVMKNSLQRRISPSVEDLEKLLTEKVAEIGKASAEKLEEVVFHLEQNYKGKLEELEKEIKLKNESKTKITEVQESAENTRAKKELKAEMAIQSVLPKESAKETHQDRTYVVEDIRGFERGNLPFKEKDQQKNLVKGELPKQLKESASSESNRTFTKSGQSGGIAIDEPMLAHQNLDTQPDTTDVSETLSEEEETNDEQTTSEESDVKDTIARNTDMKRDEKTKEQNRNQSSPKKYTRKDAKKLANIRLSTLGFDISSKSISSAKMKKATAELSQQRNDLKQKHPNFMATRSRIKKFVDKLCSKKLPANAENLLFNTKPQQPPIDIKSKSIHSLLTDDSFETLEPSSSTPKRDTKADDDFKKRLERLLSSPMHKPVRSTKTKADVHVAPVPMPRKRVMFNTLSDPKESDDDSDAPDDSSTERNNTTHANRPTKEHTIFTRPT